MTDVHIADTTETPKGGVDTRSNFLKIVQKIADEAHDLMVLTGDICLDVPKMSIYEWAYRQLNKYLDISKIDFIAGNHDQTNMMCAAFGLEKHLRNATYYYTRNVHGYLFVFLDTSRGVVDEGQMGWLKNEIESSGAREIIIFMHHPPVYADVPYMDHNHAMKGRLLFQTELRSFTDRIFHIFCGHYHVDRTVAFDNLIVYITPSTYFQIDASVVAFRVDHLKTAYRVIDLNEGRGLISYVKYL